MGGVEKRVGYAGPVLYKLPQTPPYLQGCTPTDPGRQRRKVRSKNPRKGRRAARGRDSSVGER